MSVDVARGAADLDVARGAVYIRGSGCVSRESLLRPESSSRVQPGFVVRQDEQRRPPDPIHEGPAAASTATGTPNLSAVAKGTSSA